MPGSRTPHAMSEKAAAVRFPPPLVFLLMLLLGVFLQRLLSLNFLPTDSVLVFGLWIAGLGLIVLGSVILAICLWQFVKSGQNPEPWKPTPELIVTGLYRYSRNPMYLGMALLQLGIGALIANGWVMLSTPAAMWLVYKIAIAPEEVYLRGLFGDDYLQYTQQVGRWL